MSQPLLTEVPGFENLSIARRKSLSCVVIALKAGGVCLYSPVEKLSSGVLGDLPVRFLLAPNHYHNKAIAEFADAFPEARLLCPDAARPRLEKITERTFEGSDVLASALPDNITIMAPDGLKTGEIWLSIRSGSRIAWVVTDAFCGEPDPGQPHARAGLLKTFPRYGVKDAATYANWVRNLLETEVPDLIVPCHGGIVQGADLKQDILALLAGLEA